jgi:trehalose utilization protein
MGLVWTEFPPLPILTRMNPLRVVVWGENIHEQKDAAVAAIYPHGMHTTIAAGIREFLPTAEVSVATLQEPQHGLSVERLAATDVLTWWGHRGHAEVSDEVAERVQRRVLEGMGLIVLHSGHYSKVFKRLMGTTCSLTWRVAAEKERLWVCNPGHPIAQGIDRYFELPAEETYGEPFAVPVPDEQVFISWFAGGEVFRSGCCWRRGNGKIFYFQPGHEIYPTYFNPNVRRVIANAVEWARPQGTWVDSCPNAKIAPESGTPSNGRTQ